MENKKIEITLKSNIIKNILIIEDDPNRLYMFGILLKQIENVNIARNSYEIFSALNKIKYDVILLDHDLGFLNFDGYYVAKYQTQTINNNTLTIIHGENTVGSDNIFHTLENSIKAPYKNLVINVE